MAKTIENCFDFENTRFKNDDYIIDKNEIKSNTIFNIEKIAATLRFPIVVSVLNEIIDASFFESLMKFISKDLSSYKQFIDDDG